MKNKRPTLVSPVGTFKYPAISVPSTKFVPEGVYQVSLLLPKDDPKTTEFCSKLVDLAKQAQKSLVEENGKRRNAVLKQPYKVETDENGNETGYLEIGFKNRAKGKNKDGEEFDVTVPAFDAKGVKLEDKKIGGGTKGRISFQPVPFALPNHSSLGLTLRLKAVQVTELHEYTSGGSSSFGFSETDGYQSETAPEAAEAGFGEEAEGNHPADF